MALTVSQTKGRQFRRYSLDHLYRILLLFYISYVYFLFVLFASLHATVACANNIMSNTASFKRNLKMFILLHALVD